MKFIGVPHEIPVPSEEPVTISPAGLGVTLTVPPGAIPSDPDKPANVTLKACLPSPSFTYPVGAFPVSAVYHLAADCNFKKKVEMTFEHFAKIESEEQAGAVTLFKADSSPKITDGKREICSDGLRVCVAVTLPSVKAIALCQPNREDSLAQESCKHLIYVSLQFLHAALL